MARISAAEIARVVASKRIANGAFLISCPVPGHGRGRGDRNPSCVVRDGDNGRLIFHCFAGCDGRDVVQAARQREWIIDARSAPGQPDTPKAQAANTHQIARNLWERASPGKGSPAEHYLNHVRGIPNPPMDRLRFHPRVWHSGAKMHLPALVAPIFRVDHENLQGVQVIYLQPGGVGKAEVNPAKRTLGHLKYGGVWLGNIIDTVAIAEGIETALSVQCATAIPAVASLSAHTLSSLLLPDRARIVVIAADAGNVGERCAHDAAERWTSEGRTVRIALPGRKS